MCIRAPPIYAPHEHPQNSRCPTGPAPAPITPARILEACSSTRTAHTQYAYTTAHGPRAATPSS